MKQGQYSTGGPAEVDLRPPTAANPQAVATARAELEAFRSECQRQYMAFSLGVTLRGQIPTSERWQFLWDPEQEDVLLSVGTAPPATERVPGRSTFAAMTQREFLDAVLKGGDFGYRDANAFIVFVYSLWEHRCRPKIARLFGVENNAVDCVLMGDLRYVRHAILHTEWTLPEKNRKKLKMLPELWDEIPDGELRISAHMVTELMKQINALRVEIQ